MLPNYYERKFRVPAYYTSKLPAHESLGGMEAGGSSGHPATPQFKLTWGHAAKDGSTENVGKTTLVPPKAEKGELLMGPMVTLEGSQRIARPLLKNPYRWWGNI